MFNYLSFSWKKTIKKFSVLTDADCLG